VSALMRPAGAVTPWSLTIVVRCEGSAEAGVCLAKKEPAQPESQTLLKTVLSKHRTPGRCKR